MGAGNVKAPRMEPPLLRLPYDVTNTNNNAAHNAHAQGTRTQTTNKGSHNIGPTPSASPSNKKWNVIPNVHRGLICRFCGGKSCKREDWTKQEDTPAIRGLHSTWVSANVLGMQRPSTRLIKEFHIIDQFKKAGIGAVINLQLPGEHPHCGDGIDAGGFSYRSEDFTDHGIYTYNPGWVDMDTPTLERMIEIVQIMSFHSEKSHKIAVHCHAGYGRTGIVIACFFVYAYGLTPDDAIKSVRDRRKGSVQTTKQRKFVTDFYEYVTYLRTIFPSPIITPYGSRHGRTRSNASAAGNGGVIASNLAPAVGGIHPDSDDDLMDHDSEFGSHADGIGANGNSAGIGGNSSLNPRLNHRDGTNTATGYPGLLFTRRNALLLSAITAEHDAAETPRYTLHESLSRQRAILHGTERNTLKFIPKILDVLCTRLHDLSLYQPRLAATAFLDGFKKTSSSSSHGGGGSSSLDRRFDEEREREKERKKAKERLRKEKESQVGSNHPSPAVGPMRPSSTTTATTQQSSSHSNDPFAATPSSGDGSLGILSSHGALSQHSPWEFGSIGQSRTQAGVVSGVGGAHSRSLDREDGPRWTPIQEDQMSELRKKINHGDWNVVETCDIRYCAQLLLEWLDSLKEPLLPLFDSPSSNSLQSQPLTGGTPGVYTSSGAGGLGSPHQMVYSSPSVLFSGLARWTLSSLDLVMKILWNMRMLDVPTLARVYVRFAWSLCHPKGFLPDHLVVSQTHTYRIQSSLSQRIGTAGLTIQLLHQAAQAQVVQSQQILSSPTSSSSARSGAMSILKSRPHSFDSVHNLIPASRMLLDSCVETLAGFVRGWNGWFFKICEQEEKLLRDSKIGIRKTINGVEASKAQKRLDETMSEIMIGGGGAGGGGGVQSMKQPDLDTKLGGGVEATRVEVSTTAYLHSHIHHAQPRDAMSEVERRRRLEAQLLTPPARLAANGGVNPLDASFDGDLVGRLSVGGVGHGSPLHDDVVSRVGGGVGGGGGIFISQTGVFDRSRFLGVEGEQEERGVNGLEELEASYLVPNEDATERLNGFITQRGGRMMMGLGGSGINGGIGGNEFETFDEPHTPSPLKQQQHQPSQHQQPHAHHHQSSQSHLTPHQQSSPPLTRSVRLRTHHSSNGDNGFTSLPDHPPNELNMTPTPMMNQESSPIVRPRAILVRNPAAEREKPIVTLADPTAME